MYQKFSSTINRAFFSWFLTLLFLLAYTNVYAEHIRGVSNLRVERIARRVREFSKF